MPELRTDPLTGLRTIVAGERATRPGGEMRAEAQPPLDPEADPFLEGHEDRTPPELFALRPNGGAADGPGWTVRVVPNLYPALATGTGDDGAGAPDPLAAGRGEPQLFPARPAAGAHEVIVNEGRPAGASLPHSHAQLYALGFVPAAVARERERFTAYSDRTQGRNLLEDLLQEEVRRRERVVAIDRDAVAICPFASRTPFQVQLIPRRPRARFEDEGPLPAALLLDVLRRLEAVLGAVPPFNLWVRTAPAGAERFCWRIDLVPRLTNLAGLELGTGVNLNVMPPELAAERLRDAG